MKTIEMCGFQGDVMFLKVPSIPETAQEVPTKAGSLVISHSETGHHHSIDRHEGVQYFTTDDPLTCYLSVSGVEYADVVHHRPTDTHETIRLPAGSWQVRRQREYTPEGWRRVED